MTQVTDDTGDTGEVKPVKTQASPTWQPGPLKPDRQRHSPGDLWMSLNISRRSDLNFFEQDLAI